MPVHVEEHADSVDVGSSFVGEVCRHVVGTVPNVIVDDDGTDVVQGVEGGGRFIE